MDGKIHLKYQPKCLLKSFSAASRGAEKEHYVELVLEPDDLRKLNLTEEDNLILTNKKNLLDELINENNFFKTIPIDACGEDCLQTVFKNGELLIEDTFGDIKSRALKYSNFI